MHARGPCTRSARCTRVSRWTHTDAASRREARNLEMERPARKRQRRQAAPTGGAREAAPTTTAADTATGASSTKARRGKCCSFAEFGETFVEQPFYECITCELTLENGTGICRGCKRSCHVGHEVSFVGYIKAYCDCGRGGCDLVKNESLAAIAAVGHSESPSEEDADENEGSETFVDPRLSRNYADKTFWDDRYSANKDREDTDEWLVGYADIEQVLRPQLQTLTRKPNPSASPIPELRTRRGVPNSGPQILMLGCGDSQFSADLYDAGFPHITNIDISAVCIETMRQREGLRRPKMKWEVADCTDLSQFTDNSFDVVIDKTMLDALCCSSEAIDLVPKMLKEVRRVLADGGAYIIISFSLESAKASFEQAVVAEAVFTSFKPLAPTVTMIVSAVEDSKRKVATVIASDAAKKEKMPKKAAATSRGTSTNDTGTHDEEAEAKPVEFCICFLG